MELFRSGRRAVQHLYTHYPLVVNSCVGYTVFAAGDYMAQNFIDPQDKDGQVVWDKRRTFSIGFLGVWQNGFLMHFWYRALDRIVSPKTDPVTVIKKIMCDEAIFAPQLACTYLGVSSFISSNGDWEAMKKNVKEKVFSTWKDDLKVWPLANFLGFSFIPKNIRPTYASMVQLGWQTHMSSVGFKEHKLHENEDIQLHVELPVGRAGVEIDVPSHPPSHHPPETT